MDEHTSISIGNDFAEFVNERIASGRYESASDVVRAGLRLLKEHEARVASLRQILIEGENSGASEPFDFDAFIEEKRRGGTRQP